MGVAEMFNEQQEQNAMKSFDYVMENFKMLHLNRLDQGSHMINQSTLKASVRKYERARLEIMLRCSKYSVQELKHLFSNIDVETEAQHILIKFSQDKAA